MYLWKALTKNISERNRFISSYSSYWREVKAELKVGTWRQNKAETIEGTFQSGLFSMVSSACLITQPRTTYLPMGITTFSELGPLTPIINQENAPSLQASLMEAFSQLKSPLPRWPWRNKNKNWQVNRLTLTPLSIWILFLNPQNYRKVTNKRHLFPSTFWISCWAASSSMGFPTGQSRTPDEPNGQGLAQGIDANSLGRNESAGYWGIGARGYRRSKEVLWYLVPSLPNTCNLGEITSMLWGVESQLLPTGPLVILYLRGFICSFLWDKVSCSWRWMWTHCVPNDDLKFFLPTPGRNGVSGT